MGLYLLVIACLLGTLWCLRKHLEFIPLQTSGLRCFAMIVAVSAYQLAMMRSEINTGHTFSAWLLAVELVAAAILLAPVMGEHYSGRALYLVTAAVSCGIYGFQTVPVLVSLVMLCFVPAGSQYTPPMLRWR